MTALVSSTHPLMCGYASRPSLRVLMLDNYDSFTFNLVQLLRVLRANVTVVRNDDITGDEAMAAAYDAIVVSPGPGVPRAAGASMPVIRAAVAAGTPVLGVCLGHQAIAEVFGGSIVRADRPVHGKTSLIHHDGRGIYAGLASPIQAGRYHSLVVDPRSVPPDFSVCARTDTGEVMGIRHESVALEGVQFHPESVLTPEGPALLANFLSEAERRRGAL